MSELCPECAPEWIKPALGVDVSQVQELIGQRQASQLNGTEEEVPTKPEAAVLMLLTGHSMEDGEILLTHRSPSMRSHSGQIAFPGGRRDPGDTSLVDTALREAWEETDLQRHSVTPLEQWKQLHIRATGNPVSPILAHWSQPGELYPASPAETDDVFFVPIKELIDPRNRLLVGFKQWQGPAFYANGYVIWGFTAGVLAALLDHSGWSVPWDNNSVIDLRDTLKKSRNNEKMS
ncbi:NUDIX hydrolase [Corynebacterium macginleyi]|uniref:NUDIX hydrolase n=1 Tax=Corynebacterium macginleyi TaxID=38290 RepID=UPI00190A1B9D|nr:CoA pyrophosphatase [Corynebacterium macginleyi]MBK4151858.1 NUDIX domain-containing protein [Corynebacterium macginleyi]MBM0262741.1 CoA pyrophosphatase [Corynebacterium macginleyi]